MTNYDLIVIGAGAAGGPCAEAVNKAGKRVALIERHALGGTCLNYGCDPTKAALHWAKSAFDARQFRRGGGIPSISRDEWQRLQAFIVSIQNEMRGGTETEARRQMRERGIDLIIGEAAFVSPREVSVNGHVLSAEHILIATGTEPDVPDLPGLSESGFVTNQTVFDLPAPPERLAIIGGGPVGVEFAQLFARLGSQVFLFEAATHILPEDDRELASELEQILSEERVTIRTGAEITAVSSDGGGKRLSVAYSDGDSEEVAVTELLIAAGRRLAVDALNLDSAGVVVEEDRVRTDPSLRTDVPHIWAAGDVTSAYPFTHVATRQGKHVATNILKGEKRPFAPGPIPWVTYTDPELAHVGKTEVELKDEGRSYHVISLPMQKVARAIAVGQTRGRLKLLVDEKGQILGGHILAASGGELLGPILLAMRQELPVTVLADLVWPYPTMIAALGKATV